MHRHSTFLLSLMPPLLTRRLTVLEIFRMSRAFGFDVWILHFESRVYIYNQDLILRCIFILNTFVPVIPYAYLSSFDICQLKCTPGGNLKLASSQTQVQ